jgi:hypothetical protein
MNGDSNHQTKIMRALMWYGYHDNPEAWICKSSFDQSVKIGDPDVIETIRLWSWGGGSSGSLTESPFVHDADDPILKNTEELSYGYTRKGMNSNARSTSKLAADRSRRLSADGNDTSVVGALGNHFEGWNVLQLDGAVTFMAPGQDVGGVPVGEWLAKAERGGGYLAVLRQSESGLASAE